MGKITDYPSITNIGNDTILLGDGSSGTGKVAASELAQYALEEYAGSTVGGAAQSAKSALDNLAKGIIGYASGLNLDALNTESVCGVYWMNLEDSTISGTKPGSSGQGMIFVKKQTENLYRQVYVPVTEGSDYKSRYYSQSAGTWSAWAYTPMGTAINTVFGTTTIKTLTDSDNLLTLAVGHYRINNAVPINAPDTSLKYGYVTIQNRGVNGYTYYEYAVGNGNGTSFKIYHGWKASSSATTIDWAEKKIYEDISALNSNLAVKTGSVTFEPDFENVENSLTIKQSGNVVTINGFIANATFPASANSRIGKISGVSFPPQPIRVRAACGSNAYTPGADAYMGLTKDGMITIYPAAAGTTCYFSMSYII